MLNKWLPLNSFALWISLAIFPVFVFSQQSSSYPDLDKVIQQMTQRYSLTSDQVIKIRAVYVECQNKIIPYQQNRNPGNRSTIQEMRKERDEKVFKLLNSEQQTQWNKSLARKIEMRNKAENRRPKNQTQE